MVRPLRIEYEGAFYHVLSRGNERRDIFVDESDRDAFMDALGLMSQRFEIDIFTYVLMDNHYHLLLRTNNANLSKGMQWLGTTYTRRFNLKHSRTGHLFQGCFKGFLIENDAYMMELSCYIHRNPLRAGIVGRLADYRWSSYRAFAYKAKAPEWLDTEAILSQFRGKGRHSAYRQKVQRYSEEESGIWKDLHHGLIFGTRGFLEQIRSTCQISGPNAELPQLNRLLKDRGQVDILGAATVLGCNIGDFRKSPRIPAKDRLNRDMLAYLLWETGSSTNREIGSLFGLSYSAVSQRVNIMRGMISKEKQLRHKYEDLKSRIKV